MFSIKSKNHNNLLIGFGWNFQEMIITWLLGELWGILIILVKSCLGMPKSCPKSSWKIEIELRSRKFPPRLIWGWGIRIWCQILKILKMSALLSIFDHFQIFLKILRFTLICSKIFYCTLKGIGAISLPLLVSPSVCPSVTQS